MTRMIEPDYTVMIKLIYTHTHTRHLAEPQEIADSASGWSRTRSSDGRAAYGDG